MSKRKKEKGKSTRKAAPAVPVSHHDRIEGQRGAVWIWMALVGTVLVANADIMVLELVAGRLVARYLGQSLYTWTSIIGVVLAGMSVGAYLGGRLADRYAPPKLLAILFGLAGVACLGILPLNTWAGTWEFLRGLSWASRILVHITVTFVLPCILLGAIGPVVTRFALRYMKAPGRGLGLIYAAAAAGSVGGTFLTGFFLLAVLGNSAIVYGVAALLTLLALAHGIGAYTLFTLGQAFPDTHAAPLPSQGVPPAPWYAWVSANATLLASNASIMIFELTASRMATRHFGHSLYTWTTLLGCVLLGITLGNFAGGLLADRFRPKRLLSVLFFLAALACLSVPGLSKCLVAGSLLAGLPWFWQIAGYNLLSFVVPAAIMGAISPVAARMALGLGRSPGKTLGNVYAWSTLGSVGGTFLAGYVLVDRLWPVGTLCALATGLSIIAVFYGRRNVTALVAVAACTSACLIAFSPWPSAVAVGRALGFRESTKREAIHMDHSQYSWIAVTQNPVDPNERCLHLDSLLHSSMNIAEPMRLNYDYAWVYEAVLDEYYPGQRPINALMIGGGGYVFPRYTEMLRPGSHIEVIEIDPAVTHAAHEAFGLSRESSIQTFNMDARNRIEDLLRIKRAGGNVPPFDCILGDSFNQYSVPFQLTTLEFNQALSELLADDGLYLLNVIDGFPGGQFLGSVINTCRAVFPHVYVFSCMPTDMADRDTFVVVASRRELELEDVPLKMRRKRPYYGQLLSQTKMDTLAANCRHRVLTDDYAPVDNLLLNIAHTQEGQSADGLGSLTTSLLAQGKNEEALERIRDELRAHPGKRSIRHYLAVTLARLGKQDEAIPLFRQLLETRPGDYELHYNLATALAESGDITGAVPYYETALRSEPSIAQAHFVLGQYYFRAGNESKALHHLSETARFQPANGHAHYLLGKVLTGKGQNQQALEQFQAALQSLPQDKVLHYSLGVLLLAMERHQDAATHFKTVLHIAPDSEEALLNLGGIYYLEDNLEEASRCYREAIRLRPGHAPAHYNLGKTLAAQGRYTEAVKSFEESLKLDPAFDAARHAVTAAQAHLAAP